MYLKHSLFNVLLRGLDVADGRGCGVSGNVVTTSCCDALFWWITFTKALRQVPKKSPSPPFPDSPNRNATATTMRHHKRNTTAQICLHISLGFTLPTSLQSHSLSHPLNSLTSNDLCCRTVPVGRQTRPHAPSVVTPRLASHTPLVTLNLPEIAASDSHPCI